MLFCIFVWLVTVPNVLSSDGGWGIFKLYFHRRSQNGISGAKDGLVLWSSIRLGSSVTSRSIYGGFLFGVS